VVLIAGAGALGAAGCGRPATPAGPGGSADRAPGSAGPGQGSGERSGQGTGQRSGGAPGPTAAQLAALVAEGWSGPFYARHGALGVATTESFTARGPLAVASACTGGGTLTVALAPGVVTTRPCDGTVHGDLDETAVRGERTYRLTVRPGPGHDPGDRFAVAVYLAPE
jgi:hypothetical protein